MIRKSEAKNSNKVNMVGFTIIEVLLVLAIIGLIILILFLALPTLKRVERNNFRRNYANYTAAQMEVYKNDKGKYPASHAERCNFIKDYNKYGASSGICTFDAAKDCSFIDTVRLDVCFHGYDASHAYIGNEDELSIEFGHWCNRGNNYDGTPNPIASLGDDTDKRRYVIWIKLERAPIYCVDNQ